MGIRSQESNKRAKRGQINKFRKWIIYKPIFDWKTWEIWQYIRVNSIPYCNLYDQGFKRLGCVICPFLCSKSRSDQIKLQMHKERWPKHYNAFEKAMRKLWDNNDKIRNRAKGYNENFEQWLNNWYHGFDIPDELNTEEILFK